MGKYATDRAIGGVCRSTRRARVIFDVRRRRSFAIQQCVGKRQRRRQQELHRHGENAEQSVNAGAPDHD
jgi:hypothetical protein